MMKERHRPISYEQPGLVEESTPKKRLACPTLLQQVPNKFPTWHCDRLGRYSLYTAGATNQNYLRGIQESDSTGRVTFTSIYPACYAGRWPHIHFEVYPSLATAVSTANKVATSQIALQKSTCDQVYATSGYEQSINNLSQVTLASDMVFSDGASLELPTMSGSVAAGLTASITVAV